MTWLGRSIDWVLARVTSTNSTNMRIAVSLFWVSATGVRVLWSWTAPPWEWLVLLGAMLGLDVGQFLAKRATDSGYVAAKANVTPVTTITTVAGDPPVTTTTTEGKT